MILRILYSSCFKVSHSRISKCCSLILRFFSIPHLQTTLEGTILSDFKLQFTLYMLVKENGSSLTYLLLQKYYLLTDVGRLITIAFSFLPTSKPNRIQYKTPNWCPQKRYRLISVNHEKRWVCRVWEGLAYIIYMCVIVYEQIWLFIFKENLILTKLV